MLELKRWRYHVHGSRYETWTRIAVCWYYNMGARLQVNQLTWKVACRTVIAGDKENKHQKANHQLNQHHKQYKKQFKHKLKQKFKQQVLFKQYKIMVVNVNLLLAKYYNNAMAQMNKLRWLNAIFSRERIICKSLFSKCSNQLSTFSSVWPCSKPYRTWNSYCLSYILYW